VRRLLQHLADTAADAEGRPRRPVPVLAAHAVGDQLVVLVADVRAQPGDGALEDVAERLTALRREL
jgi:hypothetical protein